ncbi:MAG TPA: hypothetical protein VFQ67_15720 [Allosphingosinicella sp.]|jgi:hypothetical protein|nr:hypothetical protein [Allosphingosinicella sp.]
MTDRAITLLRLTALGAAFALAACNRGGGEDNLADLANDADPAVTSALNDQILVDENLVAQSNRNAARPSPTPAGAPYPAPEAAPGKAAEPPAALAGPKGCSDARRFDYNMAWASRLAPNFPVYPGGKVTEAAANNSGGCSTRVVTFATADDWQRVLNWYHTKAVRAGYSSEHQIREGDHILAGSNESDKGAFYLIVTPRPKGSEVALIANNGR